MKNKEKRKRINQGFGMFITTKVATKIKYTPKKKKRKLTIDEYDPSEECLHKLAKEIAAKHRGGESRFAQLLLEELSKK